MSLADRMLAAFEGSRLHMVQLQSVGLAEMVRPMLTVGLYGKH